MSEVLFLLLLLLSFSLSTEAPRSPRLSFEALERNFVKDGESGGGVSECAGVVECVVLLNVLEREERLELVFLVGLDFRGAEADRLVD